MTMPTELAAEILQKRRYIDGDGKVRNKDESAVRVAKAYLQALGRPVPSPTLDMREQKLKMPHERL